MKYLLGTKEIQKLDIETHSIRHDRLLAASALVPAAQRDTFFKTLFVGGDDASSGVDVTMLDQDDEATSYPITSDQARELKSKVDEATWVMIEEIVANAKDGVGTIDWPQVKKLTGVTHWAQFAKGRMGGLHRSLRKIADVPKNAVLLWEGDGWVEDGQGDFSAGTVVIDGPAVSTLRSVCGLSNG